MSHVEVVPEFVRYFEYLARSWTRDWNLNERYNQEATELLDHLTSEREGTVARTGFQFQQFKIRVNSWKHEVRQAYVNNVLCLLRWRRCLDTYQNLILPDPFVDKALRLSVVKNRILQDYQSIFDPSLDTMLFVKKAVERDMHSMLKELKAATNQSPRNGA
ncbi:hypothetical protein L596_001238 [Steinernema carpocapsae]|uniref:Uncharacterized protein n=1 Tax=Steinernema carpocapsae TaxID=34508 RepID=A0A4U8UL01_STECR|nr:hypothetical protein L596_001238 [Steinernema carpocapsae]